MFLMMCISDFLKQYEIICKNLCFLYNFVEILKTRFRTSFILIMFCSFAELTFTRLQEAQKYVEFVICPKKNIVYEVGRLRS